MILQNLAHLISYAIESHRDHATKSSKTVRKWDGRTPYGIHPTWCATTLLTETTLPEELRIMGAEALLFHDVLEDTTAELPHLTSHRVRDLVDEMTFDNSDEEMERVWSRSQECKLLKLYDKVSNLLDGVWMTPEKRAKYVAYTLRLAEEVERDFGPQLNILKIARAVCA